MKLRMAHNGRNAGGQFYGCSRFPQCRGTRDNMDIMDAKLTRIGQRNTPGQLSDSSKLDEYTQQKFTNLIKYYRECVQVEGLNEIELFASEENKEFIQCVSDVEWLTSEKETFEINYQNPLKEFGKKYRFKSKPVSYYYSYPVYVRNFTRRDNGKKDVTILPFFIFPVSVENSSEKIIVKRMEGFRPQINTRVLGRAGISVRPEQKRDFIQKILEKWDDTEDINSNFKKEIPFLMKEFSADNIFVDNDLDKLISRNLNIQNAEEGIYATGVLFAAQSSVYTFGLEEELEDIEKMVVNGIVELPVIKSIIKREKVDLTKDNGECKLVEITPLNDEQREAIRSAFNNILTIVTGPPGTGKSQVVINIIANAVVKGQNVLFSSKNNQAVDVVLERISQIQEQPMILKFGQSSKESFFIGKLLSAVDKSLSLNAESLKTDKENYYNELINITDAEKDIWAKINNCYAARNAIDQLDLIIVSLEARLPQQLRDLLNNLSDYDFKKPILSRLEENIIELESNKFRFLTKVKKLCGYSLKVIIRGRISTIVKIKAYPKELREYFLLLISSNNNLLELARNFVDANNLLELLNKCGKLRKESSSLAETLVELEGKLSSLQKNRYSISPRFIDVLMSEKLRNLGGNGREDIADYEAILKRIEHDVIGGEVAKELRQHKKRLFESVSKAFPAIAVTNLSVRHAAPLLPGVIDLVVIDEASQCDIASALPLLLRAKRAVIIGDEKQLTHVSNISRVDDQQIQAKHHLAEAGDQRFLYCEQSLFDLAKTTIGSSGLYYTLRDHYRSRAEIIEFSNKNFYGGLLRVWTDYRQLKQAGNIEGVYWHDIKGRTVRPNVGSAFNLEEAQKVTAVLKSLLPKAILMNATIGIVTPFNQQENKIRNEIKEFPIEEIEAVDLKIDTAHGFQGDERDIIIFSPVVSESLPSSTKGFLENTQNLFNVAITRSRAELHIVGDRNACASCGIEYLEKFVQYVSRSTRINLCTRNKLNDFFDSSWEELLFNELKKRGIVATPQLSIHQYKLDLALENHNPPIDIEVDGEAYHKTITGERCLSDVKRDLRLNMLGWKVKRFWVYELKYDLERCLNEIEKLIAC